MTRQNGRIMSHYICLNCRIGSKSYNRTIKCPHCGKEMIGVSVTFRIPKKKDNKAWIEVKKQILLGNIYSSIWYPR